MKYILLFILTTGIFTACREEVLPSDLKNGKYKRCENADSTYMNIFTFGMSAKMKGVAMARAFMEAMRSGNLMKVLQEAGSIQQV